MGITVHDIQVQVVGPARAEVVALVTQGRQIRLMEWGQE
jgi:hypothetical protein